MKKILTLSALLLISRFAFGQQVKSYEIDGIVKNIPSRMLYLVTMKRDLANNSSQPVIDSALITDNHFVFHRDTTLLEPSWATNIYFVDSLTKKITNLSFQNKFNAKSRSVSFILENAKMSIAGDIKDSKGLVLTGAAETEILNQFGLLIPGVYKMNNRIDSLKKAGNKEALSQALSIKNDSLISFKKKLLTLSKQNASSWVMMVNVYQNADLFTPAELNEITKVFSQEVLNTPKGKRLLIFSEQSKNLVAGASFPAFSYKDPAGKTINLNTVKGKNGTIVVFWASWCGPCRAEIPELKKVYNEYKSKGINVVSISVDHDINAWKKALGIELMQWPNISNLPGDKNEIYKKYNINAIPAIFLLDEKNNVVMTNDYRIPVLRENLNKMLE